MGTYRSDVPEEGGYRHRSLRVVTWSATRSHVTLDVATIVVETVHSNANRFGRLGAAVRTCTSDKRGVFMECNLDSFVSLTGLVLELAPTV